MKIAIFGGTGDLGRGLAINFAAAGHEIVVGSRSQERADQAAATLREALPSGTFTPRENVAAAQEGEIAIVSIPWEGIESTIPPMADALAGKVVVSVVNALKFGKSGAIAEQGDALPAASCAHRIQDLAPEAKVVVAFNNLPAAGLRARHHLNADVLVCGKSREAREAVIALTEAIPGTRALDAGPLANALIIEGMTAIIINLNKRYGGGGQPVDLRPRERPGAARPEGCGGSACANWRRAWTPIGAVGPGGPEASLPAAPGRELLDRAARRPRSRAAGRGAGRDRRTRRPPRAGRGRAPRAPRGR